MSFLYPLGLLGLIGVPVLIIIYIIKNKYTEQVIASTWLWTLSERFLKRKNPLNRLTGIISLILQILIVVCISFAVSQPTFTLPNAASDYLFILDGSGSMNIAVDGQSRIDKGKEEIEKIVSSSVGGSRYTLIYAGETSSIICDKETNKRQVLLALEQLDPGYGNAAFTDAKSKAQEYFNDPEQASMKIYLVTDKAYENLENVTLVNVSSGAENYAIDNADYVITTDTQSGVSKVNISADVWSYVSAAKLTVSLYIDGAETPESTKEVDVEALQATKVDFTSYRASFANFKLVIENTDALSLDNESIVYNIKSDSIYNTAIISDSPFFIQSSLTSLGGVNVDTFTTEEYNGQTGYGLYVFDGYTPTELPKDGAVWFINPNASLAGTGFTFQTNVELKTPAKLSYSTSTSTRIEMLLSGTVGEDMYVSKYAKCGFSRNFYTLLSYNGDPIIFAGTNNYGNREVVFSFDLHDSDMTILYDFLVLQYNLFEYTFPQVISSSQHYSGDILEINVLANCDDIRVITPSQEIAYLDTSSDLAEYTLTEVGTYQIVVYIGNTKREPIRVYSALPLSERSVSVTEASFSIDGTPNNLKRDGVYDDLLILFILLAVLFIADWMVYCYEQYQLR